MKMLLPIASLALLPACHLWFGGDDCKDAPTADLPFPSGLINPDNGQCEYIGGGGGGGGTCGDYGGFEQSDRAPVPSPDWGMCPSECTGMGEVSCQATPRCRAAYVSTCAQGADCQDASYAFAECWQIAPSGPMRGESCEGLGAYECSRHDDCAAFHDSGECALDPATGACAATGGSQGGAADPIQVVSIGGFAHCGAEPAAPQGCYSSEQCPADYSCNAGEVCLPAPGCEDPSTPCPDVCYGFCVPTGSDPGTCNGPVFCDSLPPPCPEGTVPGVADGCWTGTCIPAEQCEQPPRCAEAPSEAACIAAATCAPLYEGVNCTCDANGSCTCESQAYHGCTDA